MTNNAKKLPILWVIAGTLVLIFAIGCTIISHQFVYGIGHAERPIPFFLGLYGIGWTGFVVGMILCRAGQGGRYSCLWTIAIGIIARGIFLSSNLIQENDCYRYVLDGECVVHGVNPYIYSPEEIADKAPSRLKESLETASAQLIISRVGYPQVPTIYPPLAQACFALGARITPWDWFGQRVIFLGLDLATILLILLLLKRLGKPTAWSLIYVWNPLVLKEVANSAHLDSLVGFCLILSFVFLEGWCRKRTIFSAMASGLAYGSAVLAKLYPLILFPIYAAFFVTTKDGRSRDRWSHLIIFIITFCGLIFVSYLPFLGIGIDRVSEGLRTYNAEWVNNEGAFFFISYLTHSISPKASFPVDRITANFIVGMLAVGGAISLSKGERKFDRFSNAILTVLLGWFLLLPAVFPWYAIGLIAVSAINPKGLIVLLSGLFGLYYLLFIIDYREYPYSWRYVVQITEHGLIWIWILFKFCRKIRTTNSGTT